MTLLESLARPQDPAFGFLADTVVVYYAGLDESSLPFDEGKILIETTLDTQITFVKALCLVSDFVIIPPSSYFYWASLHRDQRKLQQLAQLHQAGILLSPFYSSMTNGVDFLEYKMTTASTDEKLWLSTSMDDLVPFFRALPVLCRDVKLQSGGFRDILEAEIKSLPIPFRFRNSLIAHIGQPCDDQVLVSRSDIHSQLMAAMDRGDIFRRSLRQLFYLTNRAYYMQGARTYGASVSLTGAERYSVLGEPLFSTDRGVLLAYDPRVILKILGNLGIEQSDVSALTVDYLLRLRSTDEFRGFKNAYKELALAVQRLEMSSRQMSRAALTATRESIMAECAEKFHNEESHYLALCGRYDLCEMIVSSVVLGAIGAVVKPLTGFVLGLLPLYLHANGVAPTLRRYIVARIAQDGTAFYRYVQAVRKASEEVDQLPTCREG